MASQSLSSQRPRGSQPKGVAIVTPTRLGALPRWSHPGGVRLLFVGVLLSGLGQAYPFMTAPGFHRALGPRHTAMDLQGKGSRSIHWPAATAVRAARSGQAGGMRMSGDGAEVLGLPSSRAEKLKEAWRLAGEARLAFEAAKQSAARADVLRQARPSKDKVPPVLQLLLCPTRPGGNPGANRWFL